MAGIQGIVGLAVPTGTSPTGERPAKRGETKSDSGTFDRVVISSEAQGAAAAARLAASTSDEVRHHRVEQARKSIEEGAYRLQSVVELVASRVSRYLD